MDLEEDTRLPPIALEHARHPRNLGPISNSDGHARITGPCGETMEFWVKVDGEKVKKAAFVTDGCAPSLAAGSMATCLAEGKRVEETAGVRQGDILEALGGLPRGAEHCARLAADTLGAACRSCMDRARGGNPDRERNRGPRNREEDS